jgi:transposase
LRAAPAPEAFRFESRHSGRRSRKRAICYDKERYRDRHLIEYAFCRLKDFRRVHTRYDKIAANFLSGVAFATAIAFWL